MGRPPQSGGPAFRFMASEVAEMEACLQDTNNAVPTREVLCSFADKFSASPDRAGKIIVQPKQVWNWFQNRRYAQKAKTIKSPAKLSVSPMPPTSSSGRSVLDTNAPMEFEARSARDGAWYDVATFIAHRTIDTADLEVRVRFAGFGSEEDEWVNVRKHVRQRSLPCEASECVAVLPGDLILCFQEGKDQALYFDAHVLDAQRRRHDIRGCRCRFLVRYDHDLSEEIVPLRKVCRRPETDYRLHLLHASKEAALEAKNTNSARKQEAYSAEAQDTTATTATATATATASVTATGTATGEGDENIILKREEEEEEEDDDDDDDEEEDDDVNDDEEIEELLPASTTI